MNKLIVTIIFLLSIHIILNAQIEKEQLLGSWIKYKVEMKDGSRVVDHEKTEESFIKFLFDKETIKVFDEPYRIVIENKYTVDGSNLDCAFVSFSIEKLNDRELILLEIKGEGTPEDKIKRYYYLKEDFALATLIKNKEFDLVNDSTILAYEYITPYIPALLEATLQIEYFELINGDLTGYLIINKKGEIAEVEILEERNLNEKNISLIKDKLSDWGGKWELPNHPTLKMYNYKIDFEMHIHSVTVLNYTYNDLVLYSQNLIEEKESDKNEVTEQDKEGAIKSYNKANEFLAKEDYLKAIKFYSKSVDLDSLYFDAYYNRAYSNMKLNNMEEACKDWYYLKQLGQITAVGYFQQYCTKE